MWNFVADNISELKARIARAAEKSGRRADRITIVAVSKTFPEDAIRAAVKAGITDIGENRIQEAEPKIKNLGKIARWHMIGHLQSNKVKRALKIFDTIQSIDSFRLAEMIDTDDEIHVRTISCLIEVNSSGEKSKFGVAPAPAIDLIKKISFLQNIKLRGLMTIGPMTDDTARLRAAFRATRELFERGKEIAGDDFNILSMGMSADFEIAIEEGANMVRLGTAIFGRRNANNINS
jgi:pyridoxal phosphate enzyme (YggS family)